MAQGSLSLSLLPGTWGLFHLQEMLLRKPQGEEQPQVPTASDSVTQSRTLSPPLSPRCRTDVEGFPTQGTESEGSKRTQAQKTLVAQSFTSLC